jgi:hypothetical protein
VVRVGARPGPREGLSPPHRVGLVGRCHLLCASTVPPAPTRADGWRELRGPVWPREVRDRQPVPLGLPALGARSPLLRPLLSPLLSATAVTWAFAESHSLRPAGRDGSQPAGLILADLGFSFGAVPVKLPPGGAVAPSVAPQDRRGDSEPLARSVVIPTSASTSLGEASCAEPHAQCHMACCRAIDNGSKVF